MKPTTSVRLLLLALPIVGLGVLFLSTAWSPPKPTRWLVVSPPVFGARAKARAIHPIISLAASNAGPETISFEVVWLECRIRSGFKLMEVAGMHPRGVRKQVLLPPGAATNVVVEVSKDGPIDEACWFCCQIDWVEKESRLELLAKKLDGPMYWMAAVLGANWNPPWRHKHHDYGVVFASNVSAASYFNEVYGFTQGQWLEEQRLEQQRQDELARLQTASRPAAFRSGRGLGKPPTAEEVVAAEAKRAFAAFCRASTNGTDNAAAGASPTPELGAPPSGSPDPRGINPR